MSYKHLYIAELGASVKQNKITMNSLKILKFLTLLIFMIISCKSIDEKNDLTQPNQFDNLSLSENEYVKKYNIKTRYDFNENFVLLFKALPDTIKRDYFFSPDILMNRIQAINMIDDYAQNNKLNPNNFLVAIRIGNTSRDVLFSASYSELLAEKSSSLYLSELKKVKYEISLGLAQPKEIDRKAYIQYLKETIYRGSPRDIFGNILIQLVHNKCDAENYKFLIYKAANGGQCLDCSPIALQFINFQDFGVNDLKRNSICDK